MMDEFELYKKGLSIPEVHSETGIPLSTLRSRFKKEGILRSRGDGVRKAVLKGRYNKNGGKFERSLETKEKLSVSRKKLGDEKAIGFRFTTNGYMEFTRGGFKGRLVHDVLMEKIIKRPIQKDECVHHKDGNRCNNHPDNLELMTRKKHASHHASMSNRNRNEKGQYI